MPKFTLPVPETENGFIRPVTLEVVRKLMSITGISPETQLYYPSDLERTAQTGSTITGDAQPNFLQSNQRIWIEVDEVFIEDGFGNVAASYPDAPLVFLDDALGVAMKPVYAKAEYTISFKYRAIDKTAAERWRNEMKTKMGLMREQIEHNPSFSYMVPIEYMAILHEIHRLRENIEGYGDTFESWMASKATKRLSNLSTLVGTELRPAIAETAGRVTGWFDFAGVPEKGEKENESPTWTISFDYKFQMDKPIDMHIAYPVAVHGQIIKYLGHKPESIKDRVVGASLSMAYQYAFEAQVDTDRYVPYLGYKVPAWDEFDPNTIMPNTMRIVEVLVGVDDSLLLCNLITDLDGIEFTPAIARFLKSEAPYLAKPEQSLFVVSLYRDQDLVEAPAIRVDSDLNVWLINPQSARKQYHVRLDLYINWRRINPAAIDRAREDSDALKDIILTIDPTLTSPDPLEGSTYVPKPALDGIINSIEKSTRGGNDLIRQFNTVGVLFIVAHKATDHASS